MELGVCIPKDKHDLAALERARELGFPALNPVLGDLLDWLQDMNWPVAEPTAELLSTAGVEIVPHVKGVFRSDDSVWKYWILTSLCPKMPTALLAELGADIDRLAVSPSNSDCREDVHVAANRLLSALL
jgi:hypothetical protein